MSKPTIIAYGAHSCLVSPQLLCKNETSLRSRGKTVSKIFREKQTWKDEVKEGSKIIKIPDYHKYFIAPLQHCTVDESQKVIWRDCEKLIGEKPSNEPDLYQIVMNDGGISLKDYMKEKGHIDYREWIDILLKILICLKVLSENKLVHMDCKLANIVYDVDKKIVKLIDFGLTTSFEEVYIPVYKSRYMYWPIEFIMYEHCADNKRCDAAAIIEEFSGLLKNTIRIKSIKLHSHKVLRSEENLAKIDIYSIGITCVFIHSILRGVVPKSYENLVDRMSAIDCLKRISIDDAIVYVKKYCLD